MTDAAAPHVDLVATFVATEAGEQKATPGHDATAARRSR